MYWPSTFIISGKTCKLYSPPVDGSLTCMDLSDGLKFCSVQCKDGKEYTFSPPMLYYCSSGAWNFRPLPGMPYETTLPWPDCSGEENGGNAKKTHVRSCYIDKYYDNNDEDYQYNYYGIINRIIIIFIIVIIMTDHYYHYWKARKGTFQQIEWSSS